MEREMMIVKLCGCTLLLAFTVWMIIHTVQHNRRAKAEASHHLRIVKLEERPSQKERVDDLERRVEALEGETPVERIKHLRKA